MYAVSLFFNDLKPRKIQGNCGKIMHFLFNEGSNFCFSIASMAFSGLKVIDA
jgi:hypothetical protein